MSPQEIQALIDAKIAGQGSAVDVGGALPQILSEILNLAKQASSNPVDAINLSPVGVPNDDDTEEQAAVKLGLTIEQLRALFDGKLKYITVTNSSATVPEDGLYLCILDIESNGKRLYFYKGQEAMSAIYTFYQGEDGGQYYYAFAEV